MPPLDYPALYAEPLAQWACANDIVDAIEREESFCHVYRNVIMHAYNTEDHSSPKHETIWQNH